jgi:hypothetical protein
MCATQGGLRIARAKTDKARLGHQATLPQQDDLDLHEKREPGWNSFLEAQGKPLSWALVEEVASGSKHRKEP